MIVEAINKKGKAGKASVIAIVAYIEDKYPVSVL